MSPSAIFEFNATDVDARVNAGIAVLMVNADEGRVLISRTPEVLDRLGPTPIHRLSCAGVGQVSLPGLGRGDVVRA